MIPTNYLPYALFSQDYQPYPASFNPMFCFPHPHHNFPFQIPNQYYHAAIQQWPADSLEPYPPQLEYPEAIISPPDQVEGGGRQVQSSQEREKGKENQNRPKKNVESNISNQVFSYVTAEHKSKDSIMNIFKNDSKKIQLYYRYCEVLIKSKKKYLSRRFLGDLCIMSQDREEWQQIKKKKKTHILPLEEFRTALSYLVFHYLRNKCSINVLTSAKMSSELRRQHLDRRREVLNFLQEYVRPDLRYR